MSFQRLSRPAILTTFVFCMAIFGTSTSTFATPYSNTSIDRSCEALLGAMESVFSDKSPLQSSSESGYRSRLAKAVQQVDSRYFDQLFKNFDSALFGDLYWIATLGNDQPTVVAGLNRLPQIRQLLLDLHEFNRDYPAVLWESSSASKVIADLLSSGHQGGTDTRYTHPGANALYERVNTLLTAVISRSLMEYEGKKLGRSLGQRLGDAFKRFILPHYRRVEKIVSHGRVQQNQLALIAAIDGIVLNRGIHRADSFKFNENEIKQLNRLVDDSPAQIERVAQELARVFSHEHVVNGLSLTEDHVNIYALYKNVKPNNLSEDIAKNQREAEAALDQLEGILAQALKRTNSPQRTLEDWLNDELQIRYDEHYRKGNETSSAYFNATSESSNVSYTVEDSYTRQVPDGTDKDGHTTYRTETYYVDRTVTPSYENILSNSFDRGDGSVSGLDQIINDTQELRDGEGQFRVAVRESEELNSEIAERYNDVKTSTNDIDDRIAQLAKNIKNLNELLPKLQAYAAWSTAKIHQQWRRDSTENFRKRNQALLSRLQAQIKLSEITIELLKRHLDTLSFSVKYTDLSSPLKVLRNKMYTNYAIKIVPTVLAAGGTIFALAEPDKMQMAMAWLAQLLHLQ